MAYQQTSIEELAQDLPALKRFREELVSAHDSRRLHLRRLSDEIDHSREVLTELLEQRSSLNESEEPARVFDVFLQQSTADDDWDLAPTRDELDVRIRGVEQRLQGLDGHRNLLAAELERIIDNLGLIQRLIGVAWGTIKEREKENTQMAKSLGNVR